MLDVAAFFAKKAGWCAHYASSSALVLRAWGFPTRLVSGYLGGSFNDQGDYFSVSEDDAHVWIELWNGQEWQRVDPTLWIVPERGQFDGAQFFSRQNNSSIFSPGQWPGWARSTQMWFDSMNYRFLVWSEEFDRDKQRTWAGKLKWNLSTFYMAGLVTIVMGVLLYWLWELWRTREQVSERGERVAAREHFIQWLKQRELSWAPSEGASTLRQRITQFHQNKYPQALAWLDEWELSLYAEERKFNPQRLKEILVR
jgi:hypothetical protein